MTLESTYHQIEEWDEYENAHYAYNPIGDQIAEIAPFMNERECLRWNETYLEGRGWLVICKDGSVVEGRAKDLRIARKEVAAALAADAQK